MPAPSACCSSTSGHVRGASPRARTWASGLARDTRSSQTRDQPPSLLARVCETQTSECPVGCLQMSVAVLQLTGNSDWTEAAFGRSFISPCILILNRVLNGRHKPPVVPGHPTQFPFSFTGQPRPCRCSISLRCLSPVNLSCSIPSFYSGSEARQRQIAAASQGAQAQTACGYTAFPLLPPPVSRRSLDTQAWLLS